MSNEIIKKVRLFYNKICEKDKNKVFFKIYTEASSIYNNEIFMMWEQITLNYFLKIFI